MSFPGPVRSVTIDQLKSYQVSNRRYRNRRIGEFLKELHLTEGRNTGFKKILDAIRDNGSPLPEFETDDDRSYFITRIHVHEAFLQNDANDGIKAENDGIKAENDGINEAVLNRLHSFGGARRRIAERILTIVISNPNVTNAEISNTIKVSEVTVQRYMRDMKALGIIIRDGSRKTGRWVVSDK